MTRIAESGLQQPLRWTISMEDHGGFDARTGLEQTITRLSKRCSRRAPSGTRSPRFRCATLQPEALTAAKPYFVRNRLVACAAAAAAALSIVAGLNLGRARRVTPVRGQSTGSATSPDLGSPPAATTPAPAGGTERDFERWRVRHRRRVQRGRRTVAGGTPVAAGRGAARRPGVGGVRAHGHPDRGRDGLLRPDRGRDRRATSPSPSTTTTTTTTTTTRPR